MTWIVRSARDLFELPSVIGRWPDEEHDRAQDALSAEKLVRPNNIVEMSQEGAPVLWVLHVGDRLDSIFSSEWDAEAWGRQISWRLEVGLSLNPDGAPISIIAHQAPDFYHTKEPEPECVRPTAWERLLADDD